MNINTEIDKYVALLTNPGLVLVFIPPQLDLGFEIDGKTPRRPMLISLDNPVENRQTLRDIRNAAVRKEKKTIIYIDALPPETTLDHEADVVLSVSFDMSGGRLKVNKFRTLLDKPKDTYFLYEA